MATLGSVPPWTSHKAGCMAEVSFPFCRTASSASDENLLKPYNIGHHLVELARNPGAFLSNVLSEYFWFP
ncbi:MAG: hypothetical protein R3C61_12090 [Bacteroidia bacterium]